MKSLTIPTLPRFTLTILEPLMSLNGARLAVYHPHRLISNYFTRGSVAYDPSTQTLYTQLAGFWLFFALLEVLVLLPRPDDKWLWKRICWTMLVSDAVYFWAAAQAVGGWGEFLQLGKWSGDEWACTLGALWSMVMRGWIVFVLG